MLTMKFIKLNTSKVIKLSLSTRWLSIVFKLLIILEYTNSIRYFLLKTSNIVFLLNENKGGSGVFAVFVNRTKDTLVLSYIKFKKIINIPFNLFYPKLLLFQLRHVDTI